MEKIQQAWDDRTNAIWVGVLLFVIAGFVYYMAAGIVSLISPEDNIFLASGAKSMGRGGFLPFFRYLLLACIVVGYALFIFGLKGFRDILEPEDGTAVRKLYAGAICNAVAYVWLLAGFGVTVTSILNIIAFTIMLFGYIPLKNSETFPAKARKGASGLFLSAILSIAACILSFLFWIPMLGYVIGAIAGVFVLVAFILTFTGWAQIKNANAEEL